MVSVIMPAFNAAAYIDLSIQSVISQTFQDWELIIVDDGSTDETAQIVRNFQKNDSRIFYYYQDNGRQAKARNNGISKCSGDLIALLDADDLWEPQKLEVQIKYMEDARVDATFGPYTLIDEAGNPIKTIKRTHKLFCGEEGLIAFLDSNPVMTSSLLMRKPAFEIAGGFDDKRAPVEDHHLWISMLLKGNRFLRTTEALSSYRRHAQQASVADAHLCTQAIDSIKDFTYSDCVQERLRKNLFPNWYVKLIRSGTVKSLHQLKIVISDYQQDCGRDRIAEILCYLGQFTGLKMACNLVVMRLKNRRSKAVYIHPVKTA